VTDRCLFPARPFLFRSSGSRIRVFSPVRTVLMLGFLCVCSVAPRWAACATPKLWTEASPTAPALPALQQLNTALVTLTQRILPTVVSLRVQNKTAAASKSPAPLPEDAPPYSTGSGFISRADGLLLTN
jgi:S1-C subfamily serine protease